MPLKVSRSEAIAQIPQAKINLTDILDCDCIEEMALRVIIDSIDYSLETSARRLKSLGKIYPSVEQSAYGKGDKSGILPLIRGIREALIDLPVCEKSLPAMSTLSPIEAMAVAADKESRALSKEKLKSKPKPKAKARMALEPKPRVDDILEKGMTNMSEKKPFEEQAMEAPAAPSAAPAFTTEQEAALLAVPPEARETVKEAFIKSKEGQEFIRKKYGNPGSWSKSIGPDGKVVRWESVDPVTGIARPVPKEFWPK